MRNECLWRAYVREAVTKSYKILLCAKKVSFGVLCKRELRCFTVRICWWLLQRYYCLLLHFFARNVSQPCTSEHSVVHFCMRGLLGSFIRRGTIAYRHVSVHASKVNIVFGGDRQLFLPWRAAKEVFLYKNRIMVAL